VINQICKMKQRENEESNISLRFLYWVSESINDFIHHSNKTLKEQEVSNAQRLNSVLRMLNLNYF
jgi:hypothetical protein